MIVLIMSSDGYDDTWKPFYTLYKKYWNKYDTYLCTETKTCPYFKTINTTGSWTSRLRQALEQINDKYVFLMLDDFFLHSEVDNTKVEEVLSLYDDNIACFNFELNYSMYKGQNVLNGFIERQNREPYLNSCQPSIHDRKKLIERLQYDQTPWEWETTVVDSPYKFYINNDKLVFDIGYYEEKKPWCITQGKWTLDAKKLFEKENIKVDFDKRGFYDKIKLSIITPYYKTLDLTMELYKVLKPQLNEYTEWLIIDDGCNETELDKLACDNIKIIHKPNYGVSSARNQGLRYRQGMYVAFVDSDDMIPSYYVFNILKKIDSCYFDYCYMSWKTRDEEIIITNEPPEWNASVWNCVYRLKDHLRFNENTQYGEEVEFNEKARIGIKANIKDIMYIYNKGRDESITAKYCKGNLDKYKPLKAQIIMFLRYVSKIGGVETFLYEFFKQYHDKYDILFLYEEADTYQLARYKKLVRCIPYYSEKGECDIYLNVNCNKSIAGEIKANHYYDMVHTDYSAMQWKYTKHPKTELTLCVSQVGQRAFLEQYPNEKSEVIYNLLEHQNVKIDRTKELGEGLKLVSATRLSWEKGHERIVKLAKRLNKLKKKFTWTIFTNDSPLEDIPNLVYKTPRYNVNEYIAAADYYVTLSNTECCSYSNFESFDLQVPIISTNYPSILEQGMKEGINGYLLDMELTNMDEVIDKIFTNNLKGFKYKLPQVTKQWDKILGEHKESNYVWDGVEVPDNIRDVWICGEVQIRDDNGEIWQQGSEITALKPERIRMLLENGLIKRKEV